jgi:hypothetical protein
VMACEPSLETAIIRNEVDVSRRGCKMVSRGQGSSGRFRALNTDTRLVPDLLVLHDRVHALKELFTSYPSMLLCACHRGGIRTIPYQRCVMSSKAVREKHLTLFSLCCSEEYKRACAA